MFYQFSAILVNSFRRIQSRNAEMHLVGTLLSLKVCLLLTHNLISKPVLKGVLLNSCPTLNVTLLTQYTVRHYKNAFSFIPLERKTKLHTDTCCITHFCVIAIESNFFIKYRFNFALQWILLWFEYIIVHAFASYRCQKTFRGAATLALSWSYNRAEDPTGCAWR